MCVCICTACLPVPERPEKRASHALELELNAVAFCKLSPGRLQEREVRLTTAPSLQPPSAFCVWPAEFSQGCLPEHGGRLCTGERATYQWSPMEYNSTLKKSEILTQAKT